MTRYASFLEPFHIKIVVMSSIILSFLHLATLAFNKVNDILYLDMVIRPVFENNLFLIDMCPFLN